jgi:uncharacterized membrane-anchored protein YhcB (DUF1043 family)
MARNHIWTAIAVAVFLAGIVIGYAIFFAGNSAVGNQTSSGVMGMMQ